MDLEKVRDFFFQHRPSMKNLLHVLHRFRAIKRVSFTSNYLTLICQSGSALLFQRVSQSEAIICQSNASSTTFRNTRVNGCLSTTKLLQKSKSHTQQTRQLISQGFGSDNPSLWKLMERKLENRPRI